MWKCENVKYENVRDNLIKYNCPSCNKDYLNTIYKEPKKRFKNTFKFSNNDISNFILLVRKGVYCYDYMDEWEKFNETSLPEKEFYSKLNMEDITDADYSHANRVCKDLKIQVNITICILKAIHYFWLMFLKTLKKFV